VSTSSGPSWGVNTHKRIGRVLLGILTGQLFAAKGWRVKATTREAKQVVVDLYWFGVNETALVEGYADER